MKNREREIRAITLWGAIVNIFLTVVKIIAGFIGNSAAMIADGVHSLSDLLSDIVVLIFTHISSKGQDKEHSFGHGKFETLATLIVSVILITVGGKILAGGIESIKNVTKGEVLPKPGYLALAAAVISIIIKSDETSTTFALNILAIVLSCVLSSALAITFTRTSSLHTE